MLFQALGIDRQTERSSVLPGRSTRSEGVTAASKGTLGSVMEGRSGRRSREGVTAGLNRVGGPHGEGKLTRREGAGR
jgi:hypothetical protein